MIEATLLIISISIFIGIISCLSKAEMLELNSALSTTNKQYNSKVFVFSIAITVLAILAVIQSFLLGLHTYQYLFNQVAFNAKFGIISTIVSVFCYTTFDVLFFLTSSPS